jgi:glycosyltransferase involved in cell wall biosynthesis
MAKVSVIIPTYNRQLLLKSAIKSVLNQKFQDFEIIVVDDEPNVATQELVNSFADKRLRYVRHSHNKGEAASRNTGIVNARCEFLAFLDDDDEWLPEKLALQVNLLEKASSNVGVVYIGLLFVNLSDRKILSHRIPTKRGDILKDLLAGNVIGPPSTVLLRRSCLEKVGLFDENLAFFADYDFFLRIARHYHFEYVSSPLVKYHIHEGSLTNNVRIVERGLENIKIKYSGENGLERLHKTFYSKNYHNIGTKYCIYGNIKKGRKLLIQAIKCNIFEWKSFLNILLSLCGYKNFVNIKKIKNKIIN